MANLNDMFVGGNNPMPGTPAAGGATAPNPTDYFKAPNPSTGLTDIFNKKDNSYVDPVSGASLFKSGLNADHIPGGTHPGNLSAAKPPAPSDSLTIDAGAVSSGLSKTGSMADITGGASDQLGQNDLLKKLQGFLSSSPQLAAAVAANTELSPEEIATQKKLLDITQSQTNESQSIVDRNVGGGLPGITDAITRELGDVNNGLTPTSLANLRQKTFYAQYLTLLQGTRTQKLEAAKSLFDANRNNIQDTLNVYKETAPQNISTQVNSLTGDVYVVTRNPVNGTISQTKAGNIGVQKAYTESGMTTDPMTGGLVFYGLNSDGSVDIKPVSGQGGDQNIRKGPIVSETGAITDPSKGIINGYNIGVPGSQGAYATDPNYLKNISAILTVMPPISDAASASAAIKKLNPSSPITGDMIMASAAKYGVDPALMIAIMKQETQLGTVGTGAKQNNYGNVGNTDAKMAAGTPTPMPTPQAGIDAVAANLAKRKQSATTSNVPAGQFGATSASADYTKQFFPQAAQNGVMESSAGAIYLDLSKVPATLQTAATNTAARLGIKALSESDAKGVQAVDTIYQSLNKLTKLSNDQLLPAGMGIGVAANAVKNYLGSKTGSNAKLADFGLAKDSAIKAVTALAGGVGSGLRLNTGTIDASVSNLPTMYDSKQVALEKINQLRDLLNIQLSTSLGQPSIAKGVVQYDDHVYNAGDYVVNNKGQLGVVNHDGTISLAP